MLITSEFIAELMGKRQLMENIVLDIFDIIQKNKIEEKSELLLYLSNREISNQFNKSIEICLTELVRLKLIELGKVKEEALNTAAKLKLEEIQRKNAEVFQKKDNAIDFDIEL